MRTQLFWACNSPRASSPATHLARRTRAFFTAPCPRCPSSARSTASTARARSHTSPRVATLMVALGASPAPRATPHKVCPLSLSVPLRTLLMCVILFLLRSVGVHGGARDSGSIGRGRRADARVVARGEAAAQRRHERAPRKARRRTYPFVPIAPPSLRAL